MATTPEGIMALNQPQDAAPQMSYEDSYDAMRQALQQARPDAAMEMDEMLEEATGDLSELSNEQLQELIDAVQQLYDDPENYAQNIAQAVQDGDLDQDDFPAQYDEEFLATVLVILREEQRKRKMASSVTAPMEAMLPQQFARGGIAEAARLVASKGRYGDTMLAHITPSEARLLRARGGSGTINPATGLPEFFFKKIGRAIKGAVKGVVNVAKKVVSSPVGKIVATIGLGMVMGPAVAAALPGLSAATAAGVTGALASGTVTAIGGGSLKDILTSAATGFIGAPGGPVSNFIGKYTGQFISNPTVQAAVSGAIVGTGAGLVSGQSLKESLQSGLVQGAIAGGTSFMQNRGNVAQADQAAKVAAGEAAEEATAQASGKMTESMQRKGISSSTAANPDGTFTTEYRDRVGNLVKSTVTAAPPPAPTQAEAIGGGTQRMLAQAAGVPSGAASTSAVPMNTGLSSLSADDLAPGSSSYMGARSTPALSGTLPPPATPATYDVNPILAGADEAKRAAVSGLSLGNTTYGDIPATAGAGAPTTTTVAGGASAAPYRVPEIGASLKKAVTPGTMMEGLGDLFMPGPSSAQYKDMVDDFLAKNPGRTVADATSYLEKTGAVPGMLRTYGPGVAAGIGALGMMGGFTPTPPEETEFQQQLRSPVGADIEKNPAAYYPKGLTGVTYDERGAITGSAPLVSNLTLRDIVVPGASLIGFNPMSYGIPQQMNMGGIAALTRGGYPRRVGQISGPGTEKSDSIPAMLSDGEFVMTARAVRGMGNGSRREGAKRMYALMHKLEKNAARG